MTMRVGLVEVKDGGSWGRIGGECRRGRHRYTSWEGHVRKGCPYWVRGCRNCGWVYTVVPVIAGPHVVDHHIGLGGWQMDVCRCGRAAH